METGDGYYRSPGLSITVTAHTQGSAEEGDLLTWYVADIYLADIGSFQTVLAGGEDHGRGSTADPMELYAASGGILAISGDFESYGSGGTVIRNGLLYRNETAYTDVCVLFRDGRLVCYPPGALDLDGLEAGEEPLHAWTFGPTLVENGALSERLYQRESWRAKEPRAALGYFEPGHYCFVVADGRQYGYSNGASLETLAQIFVELGCETAYNLDGGGSAFMAFNGGTGQPAKLQPEAGRPAGHWRDGGGRNMRERLLAALAHVTAVLSVAGAGVRDPDRYNPLMGFLTNRYTLGVLIVQCLLSLGTAWR